jgi:cysteine desulfurase/selenocysteine lyase
MLTSSILLLLANLLLAMSYFPLPLRMSISSINRADFPILKTDAYPGKPLVYLDSAASSQKPLEVLAAMDNYYKCSHSNVHRGAHALAMKATTLYEDARDSVKKLINAAHREEIVFTRGEEYSMHKYYYEIHPL